MLLQTGMAASAAGMWSRTYVLTVPRVPFVEFVLRPAVLDNRFLDGLIVERRRSSHLVVETEDREAVRAIGFGGDLLRVVQAVVVPTRIDAGIGRIAIEVVALKKRAVDIRPNIVVGRA